MVFFKSSLHISHMTFSFSQSNLSFGVQAKDNNNK